MKTTIISSTVCLVIGLIIGVGGYHLYQNNRNNQLESGVNVNILEGQPEIIQHEKIKNYPKHIEIITKSKGKGKIKTTIKKDVFCPKIYKNSLSFVLSGGMYDVTPVVSYGIQYRRQIFSRFHILTGVHVVTNINMPKGFIINAGAGVNF